MATFTIYSQGKIGGFKTAWILWAHSSKEEAYYIFISSKYTLVIKMFNRLSKWGYRWFLFSFYLSIFSDLEKNMYTYTHMYVIICVCIYMYYIHTHMYIIHISLNKRVLLQCQHRNPNTEEIKVQEEKMFLTFSTFQIWVLIKPRVGVTLFT